MGQVSISQRAHSKSGPVHALDGFSPHAGSFTCADENSIMERVAKHILGTRVVSSFAN